MKKFIRVIALVLLAVSLLSIALPALAVETGVLNSNVRVWKDLNLATHYGYAQQNDRIQVISGSQMASDGQVYVKVVLTSGSMKGVEGWVLQRTINRT